VLRMFEVRVWRLGLAVVGLVGMWMWFVQMCLEVVDGLKVGIRKGNGIEFLEIRETATFRLDAGQPDHV